MSDQLRRQCVAARLDAERQRFHDSHGRSRVLFARARGALLGGVPMPWMSFWPGRVPLFLKTAHGDHVTDVDGHEYVDFCLGDSSAMAGHSPAQVVRAVRDRVEDSGGVATLLPTEDAIVVGEELQRRFRLPFWQFTLSATDANRFALRICREIQQRPYVLVFSRCYHGTVSEALITLGDDRTPRSRPGNVGPAVDPTTTTKVVEYNDGEALRCALADLDVACVIMEPALTNVGIVHPRPGFLGEVRELCDATSTLLVHDETHTFSAGPGGCTLAWDLRPDMVTVGKALAAGFPMGAYGFAPTVAERASATRVLSESEPDLWGDAPWNQVGIGGTVAGNPLSSAAARATLTEVLTAASFDHMTAMASRFVAGVTAVIEERGLPWYIAQLGARAEYRFCPQPPRNGAEAAGFVDGELDEFIHLFMANRGVLMTPFHNMALMCPQTSAGDVDRHTELFGQAADLLLR